MGEIDPEYVAARTILLDALTALKDHLGSIVLVGAQAVYLRTPDSRIVSAPFTTDGDLAINPRLLAAKPELEKTMSDAGFTLEPPLGRQRQPGLWYKSIPISGLTAQVEVDLLVPSASIAHGSERGARLPDHSRMASRLAPGIEAALVDFSALTIRSLNGEDPRVLQCNVAGEAALLISKLHKLNDRLLAPGADNQRLSDKDAADVVRLMLDFDAAVVGNRIKELSEDSIAGPVATKAQALLRQLFEARRSKGTEMAVRALAGDLRTEQVEAICEGFVRNSGLK